MCSLLNDTRHSLPGITQLLLQPTTDRLPCGHAASRLMALPCCMFPPGDRKMQHCSTADPCQAIVGQYVETCVCPCLPALLCSLQRHWSPVQHHLPGLVLHLPSQEPGIQGRHREWRLLQAIQQPQEQPGCLGAGHRCSRL